MIDQYHPIFDRKTLATEINNYILSNGYMTEFLHTQEFEKELARILKVKYCSVMNNGTISLSLALLAMGVKPGDYVLIPNITMIATQFAVELIGATVLCIDVDPKNLCMDLKKAEQELQRSNKTTAVIYVTLNGRSHSMDELRLFRGFCSYNNISLIEDNAQSFGSIYNDLTSISCPDGGIGSFSFSMPKIITSGGQGGCLVTNNDELGNRIKKLKDFGRDKGGIDSHDQFGINSKFTEIQAICGLNQLKSIDWRIQRKKDIYKAYEYYLGDCKAVKFIPTNLDYMTPWFCDIYIEDRNALQEYLKGQGIQTRALYPALNTQKINGGQILFNISEYWADRGLWLPSSLDLKDEEIKFISSKIKEFYNV